MTTEYSLARRAAAWGVHAYTALGLPLALGQVWALSQKDVRLFFWLQWIAVIVDSTDGTLARRVRVREVVPQFDGRRLDDLIDFLTFAFLPAMAIPALGLLTPSLYCIAALPLVASGYGFCQERAKTEESFVGFPSYWNVVVLYMVVLQSRVWVNVVILVGLSILVFVPIHYLYPTKTKLLKRTTLGLGVIWGVTLMPLLAMPDAPWASTLGWISFAYPVYYLVLSAVNHVKVMRGPAPATA